MSLHGTVRARGSSRESGGEGRAAHGLCPGISQARRPKMWGQLSSPKEVRQLRDLRHSWRNKTNNYDNKTLCPTQQASGPHKRVTPGGRDLQVQNAGNSYRNSSDPGSSQINVLEERGRGDNYR